MTPVYLEGQRIGGEELGCLRSFSQVYLQLTWMQLHLRILSCKAQQQTTKMHLQQQQQHQQQQQQKAC